MNLILEAERFTLPEGHGPVWTGVYASIDGGRELRQSGNRSGDPNGFAASIDVDDNAEIAAIRNVFPSDWEWAEIWPVWTVTPAISRSAEIRMPVINDDGHVIDVPTVGRITYYRQSYR